MPQSPADQYIDKVRAEISVLRTEFSRRLVAYRYVKIIIIVSAALVPILAGADAVPRWILGALGAVAAVAGSVEALYQFRSSATSAMRTANRLERALNRYLILQQEILSDLR